MNDMDRAPRNEADLPASQSQAGQQARVSRPDEDAWRPPGSGASAQEGSGPTRGDDRREVVPAGPVSGEALPRVARIRRTNEIRSLLERGKRRRTASLDVFFSPSPA